MALVKSGAAPPNAGADDAIKKSLTELGLSDANKALTVTNLDGDKKFKSARSRVTHTNRKGETTTTRTGTSLAMIDGGDKGSVIVETTYKIVGFQPNANDTKAIANGSSQPKDDPRFTELENAHDQQQAADKGAANRKTVQRTASDEDMRRTRGASVAPGRSTKIETMRPTSEYPRESVRQSTMPRDTMRPESRAPSMFPRDSQAPRSTMGPRDSTFPDNRASKAASMMPRDTMRQSTAPRESVRPESRMPSMRPESNYPRDSTFDPRSSRAPSMAGDRGTVSRDTMQPRDTISRDSRAPSRLESMAPDRSTYRPESQAGGRDTYRPESTRQSMAPSRKSGSGQSMFGGPRDSAFPDMPAVPDQYRGSVAPVRDSVRQSRAPSMAPRNTMGGSGEDPRQTMAGAKSFLSISEYDEDGTGPAGADRNTMRKSVRASKSASALRQSTASGAELSIIDDYSDDRRSKALSTLNGSRASRATVSRDTISGDRGTISRDTLAGNRETTRQTVSRDTIGGGRDTYRETLKDGRQTRGASMAPSRETRGASMAPSRATNIDSMAQDRASKAASQYPRDTRGASMAYGGGYESDGAAMRSSRAASKAY